MTVSTELPKYRSHKEVWALKLKSVDLRQEGDEGLWLTPEDAAYAPFWVDGNYCRKHDPKAGGYYVKYADGYESWSPAAAFEEGHTRV